MSIPGATEASPSQVRLFLPRGVIARIVDFRPVEDHPTEKGAALIPIDLVWESRGRLGQRRAKNFIRRWVLAALCAGLKNDSLPASFMRRAAREAAFSAKHIRSEIAPPESFREADSARE